MTPAKLRTARAILRPFREDDREAAVALHEDPRVCRYMGDGTVPDGEALFNAIFGVYASQEARWFEIWAVEVHGELVGHAELKESEHTRPGELELVYCLRPEIWGKGLGGEVAAALCQRARDLERIPIATVHPENAASLSLLRRLRFAPLEALDEQTLLLVWSSDTPP